MQLIHDLLDQSIAKHGDNLAFDAPDHLMTYNQLGERVEHFAGALQELGIQKGDRVSILSPNCADYLVVQYAVSRLGGIFEVLNTRHVTDEMAYAVQNAEASALIINQMNLEHLQGLAACPSIKFTVGMGGVTTTTHRMEDLIAAQQPQRLTPTLNEKSPCVLMYTSGTTGRPKGAVQSQEGSVQADLITAQMLEITAKDNYLAFMPFFHQAGLIRARAMLSRGANSVIAYNLPADVIAKFMKEKKVTMTMLVPPYDGKLLALCEEKNITLQDLRLIIGAAGPRMKNFCEINQCRCMAVYGQTEVTGLITAIFDEDSYERPYSVGKPVSDMEMQIWDDDGNRVPTGEVGEIMANSKRCIPGYWRNEEATKELYTGEWMHTGDLGKVDEEGFLYFVNRKKELIKTGGENVYPIEVETVIRKHEDVKDIAVVGLPDSRWGEAVTAVLVTKSGKELTMEKIKEFCQGEMAGYKIPKNVFCIDEIPYNHTGKPDKLSLKKRFT